MAAFNKPEMVTKQDLLNMRITRFSLKDVSNRNDEMEFCAHLDKELVEILTGLGYEVETVVREFLLQRGRMDFLVKLKNDRYIIIEVKYATPKNAYHSEAVSNEAVGQLLSYKAQLCVEYDIKKKDVDMILLINEEYPTVHQTINFNNLPIKYLVYGKEGVKLYE